MSAKPASLTTTDMNTVTDINNVVWMIVGFLAIIALLLYIVKWRRG
jgi:LPXTG-motif cell wall-anchored protein